MASQKVGNGAAMLERGQRSSRPGSDGAITD